MTIENPSILGLSIGVVGLCPGGKPFVCSPIHCSSTATNAGPLYSVPIPPSTWPSVWPLGWLHLLPRVELLRRSVNTAVASKSGHTVAGAGGTVNNRDLGDQGKSRTGATGLRLTVIPLPLVPREAAVLVIPRVESKMHNRRGVLSVQTCFQRRSDLWWVVRWYTGTRPGFEGFKLLVQEHEFGCNVALGTTRLECYVLTVCVNRLVDTSSPLLTSHKHSAYPAH